MEIEPRKIEIYGINLEKINENRIIFRVRCSKGTYIRTLCKDIAEKLGTIGYMEELERLSVGQFKIEESITIEQLDENIKNNEFIENQLNQIDFIGDSFQHTSLTGFAVHSYVGNAL